MQYCEEPKLKKVQQGKA